jgi:hypothetical protein
MRNLIDNATNNPGMTVLCVALIVLAIFIIYANFFAPRREIELVHEPRYEKFGNYGNGANEQDGRMPAVGDAFSSK